MLLLYSTIKLVAEIALLAFVGQWVLGRLAGPGRGRNPVYRVFQILTAPFVGAVRRLTQRVLPDRHAPAAAFGVLALVWIAATAAKIEHCLSIGIDLCR